MICYRSSYPPETKLRGQLRELANERRHFGYRRLFILLRRQGEPFRISRISRLYREEGMPVRQRWARRRALGAATSGGHASADLGRGETERALFARFGA